MGLVAAKPIADWLCDLNERASLIFSIALIEYLLSNLYCYLAAVQIFTRIGSHDVPKKACGSCLCGLQRSC